MGQKRSIVEMCRAALPREKILNDERADDHRPATADGNPLTIDRRSMTVFENLRMNQRNFRITIEYDGTDFHGWQRQLSDRTVQAEIEKAVETMTRRRVVAHGSGRTDAGVHALGQVASFRCETRLSARDFFNGLNSLLPSDVVILDCREAAGDFHARYSASSKRYRYRILNRPIPAAIGRRFCWHVRKPLNLSAMVQAARLLVGTNDFSSFEAAGSPRSHSRRTVLEARWEEQAAGRLRFEIEADGFLRGMVRNIVGTLVEIGMGRRGPETIETILSAGDRSAAGPTAPARGLYLVEVHYPETDRHPGVGEAAR